MSELLSILFAAIFVSSMSLNHSAADNTKTGQNGEQIVQLNARLGFKQAENKANSEYKASIVDCRKKPSSEKKVCLDEAKAVNAKTIVALKQTAITATTSSVVQ